MQRRGFSWSQGLLLVGLTLGLGLVFWPVNERGGESVRSPCQTNLKQITLGIKQYLQDNDDRYPSLQTPAGWRVAVFPYLKNFAIFQCPQETNSGEGTTDYWFNARLSGLSEAAVASQSLTALFGDGYSSADPAVSDFANPRELAGRSKIPRLSASGRPQLRFCRWARQMAAAHQGVHAQTQSKRHHFRGAQLR